MTERVVRVKRSVLRRTLRRFYEEVDPQFLMDHEWDVPEVLVDKVSRVWSDAERVMSKKGRSRERTRTSLPYIPFSGIPTATTVDLANGLRELGYEGEWDECYEELFPQRDVEQPEVQRYVSRKVSSGGICKFFTFRDRQISERVNATIDAGLAKGRNPFRPERGWQHPRYG